MQMSAYTRNKTLHQGFKGIKSESVIRPIRICFKLPDGSSTAGPRTVMLLVWHTRNLLQK